MFRTWMFIAGNQKKHLSKVVDLPSDVLIFDLEDSVAPLEKDIARTMVRETMNSLEGKKNYVRVNELQSLYFLKDIMQVVSHNLTGIVVPKINSEADILVVDYLLDHLEKNHNVPLNSVSIVPLIETAKGLHYSFEIASASERVSALAFGAEDFMLEMNISVDEQNELLYARSKLVEVSKAANIDPPVDAVFTDLHDDEGLEYATLRAKKMGFQGKLVIHPKQLKKVNEVFAYPLEEIEEARRIVKIYENSVQNGKGAVQVDGKMVDMPVAERARKILQAARVRD